MPRKRPDLHLRNPKAVLLSMILESLQEHFGYLSSKDLAADALEGRQYIIGTLPQIVDCVGYVCSGCPLGIHHMVCCYSYKGAGHNLRPAVCSRVPALKRVAGLGYRWQGAVGRSICNADAAGRRHAALWFKTYRIIIGGKVGSIGGVLGNIGGESGCPIVETIAHARLRGRHCRHCGIPRRALHDTSISCYPGQTPMRRMGKIYRVSIQSNRIISRS